LGVPKDKREIEAGLSNKGFAKSEAEWGQTYSALNKGRNGEENEHGEAYPDAGERMAEGGPETEERESQKLISIVAVGAPESVSRNQLIKSDLPTMKNGEM
jgi:hypothetical protein